MTNDLRPVEPESQKKCFRGTAKVFEEWQSEGIPVSKMML